MDGVTGEAFRQCQDQYLAQLRASILEGTYTPSPVRRIYIPKANGKQRPLGIPTITDRIVQKALQMALEPIWESDFSHHSYGFRPERSVHHAVRTVRAQLADGRHTRGRWIVEGDLSSYFDTVHHKKLISCIRRRVRDGRLIALIWRMLKAGHVDKGLFCAASEGVPQGGVLSPLLSNIMLHEFDRWMEERFVGRLARLDRRRWNISVVRGSLTAVREKREWRPAVSYTRYADDFVIIVKGVKRDAEIIREECRAFLEGNLHLTLNMEKTHVTHVNDGFVFLGCRFIRKRGGRGLMRVVTTIPKENIKAFRHRLVTLLSANHDLAHVEMIDRLNRQLIGWAGFYQFTDHTSKVFQHIDTVVFWKMAHWLGRKYRSRIKPLIRKWFLRPDGHTAKTWMMHRRNKDGTLTTRALHRLTRSQRGKFRWKTPQTNPFLRQADKAPVFVMKRRDIARAFSPT